MTIHDLKAKLEARIERLNEFDLPEIPHQIAEINWILKEVNKLCQT